MSAAMIRSRYKLRITSPLLDAGIAETAIVALPVGVSDGATQIPRTAGDSIAPTEVTF
jgi:hypothetical protein